MCWAVLAFAAVGHGADVVINSNQTFQTITGWGHGGGFYSGITGIAGNMLEPVVVDAINYQYFDYLTDDLRLTGSRTWEVGPRIDGTGIDHGDCDVVDWNLFEADTLPASYATNLLYIQNKILTNGFQPNFYSSPGYPTHASDLKPWVMNHPGERAQQIWASALYFKNTYGININYAVIYNEPSCAVAILSDDTKAVGPRFGTQGLPTLVQYAEAITPQTDWNYITPVQNDPDMWPYVGRISYHNYGTADPYRSYLRGYGKARGLTTAQTEMGNPTFDDLYSDLTLAGVTYWEVAFSASLTLNPNAGLTAFTPSGTFFRLRQLIHYVRPGAVRVGTTSTDPNVRVLAFTTNGLVTVVIENISGSAQTVNLSGLPPGTYGLSKAANGAASFQELGLQTVGAAGTLTLANVAGSSAVTTLYPYTGPNHAPTIEVWGANPGYVVAPATNATLSVTANDAELDTLTYHWSVTNQPAGANATLATPNAATTVVNGLTVSGTYVFNVDVRDNTNTASKQLYLVRYDSNPPPVLGQTGFRFNAPYGLVFGDPSGTTHAIVELPTSSATLQVGISDLANSDFTGRGTWSVVSQPAGATNLTVGATTYIYVSIRADVTGMTVPGDYVFQVNVTNPGHSDLTTQIICTVNPSTSAPVINSITAMPATLTLPISSTQLSAAFTGSTNTTLRQWWYVKTTPAGAKPVFDHQGATNTTVSNLVLPGNYTFTLRTFDDIHMTTQDKTFTVNAAPGAPVITSPATASINAGAPFSYTITANNSPTGFTATNLPAGLIFAGNVITGTPPYVGTYNILLSATNSTGTGYGNLALTVGLTPPVITAGPTATPNPVQAGQPTAFSVTAIDPNYFSLFYLWNFGDSTTDNTPAPTHTYASAGSYPVTLTITNDLGAATSTSFPVVVTAITGAPVITTQPVNLTVNMGQPANFTVAAVGTVPLFYQWQKDGTNITGATSATATIASAQLTDAGIFSVIVSNSAGTATSSNATLTVNNPAWVGWQYLKVITINSNQVVATQTNFPVLIAITDDHDLANHARADGADLVFIDPNGNLLPFEIETGYLPTRGNTGGTKARVWVSLPTLSNASNTVINLRYGNPACTNSRQNAALVWTNGFVGVWHLGENGSPAYDSTANATTLTGNTGTTFGAAGAVGTAVSFDGSTGFLTTNTAPALALVGSPGTISAWIYPKSLSAGARICEIGTTGSAQGYQFALATGSQVRFGFSGTTVSSTANLASNTWQQVATTWDGANIQFYLQGAPAGTVADAAYPANNGTTFKIGGSVQFVGLWNGTLDEVHISNIARSADWLATEYNNQSNPTNFASINSEWSVPVVVTPPATKTVNDGQSVSFNVSVSGTAPLFYQWQKNGTTIRGATNAIYTIASPSTWDAGTYSVIISNAAGTVTTSVQLTVNPFQITSLTIQTNDILITWTTTGGQTSIVQTTADLLDAFTNLSQNIAIPGTNAAITNYLDTGGATNWPARFYRVRIAP